MSLLLVLGGDVADFRHAFFACIFTVVFAPAQRIAKTDVKSIFEVKNSIPLRREGGERIPPLPFLK